MFFTKEDILKIQQGLASLGRSDSLFEDAHIPLDNNDILVLSLDGRNTKIRVLDFLKQVHLLSSEDFINVTAMFDSPRISLSKAIKMVPGGNRKVGLTITFSNLEGNWEVWQYTSTTLNLWSELSAWDNCKIPFNSTAVPDEEDLSLVLRGDESVIQFKDKSYNPNEFSGSGRVYLRKNITKILDPVTKEQKSINFLTLRMIGKENTIYVILYDYNLNGQRIVIPTGCTLLYLGGSISNGAILYKGTVVEGVEHLDNVTTEGLVSYSSLPITGKDGQVLKILNGVPTWVDP